MKRLSGFSLMEMMIVLLIVSIVAAASAPMINKKMVTAASEKSPWVWTGTDNSIAFNLGGVNRTAAIGTIRSSDTGYSPRLFIKSATATNPQISLQENTETPLRIFWGNTTLRMSSNNSISANTTNSVLIGNNTSHVAGNYPTGLVAIGSNATANSYSVAVGNGTKSETSSIALGYYANARGDNSVAIGRASNATDTSIALGFSSNAGSTDTIAIGRSANTYSSNSNYSVAIGRAANTYSGNASVAIGNYARAMMPQSIAIGDYAYVNEGNSSGVQARAIAIGYNALATHSDSIAIGGKWGSNATTASNVASIAIGATSLASGPYSIAIGGKASSSAYAETAETMTRATGNTSMALGFEANAAHANSVAIGRSATTTTANQIVIGTAKDTVYIPGKLVVETPRGIYYKTDSSSWSGYTDTWVRIKGVTKTYDADRYISSIEKSTPDLSDKRLKNIGKLFVGGLKEIKQLETYHYTFKKDPSKTPRVGVMAQDLQKIFPDAVIKGEDGFLRIRMEDMFYALVNAVKELDTKIENLKNQEVLVLKNRVDKLEKENKALEKRLAELEKKVK